MAKTIVMLTNIIAIMMFVDLLLSMFHDEPSNTCSTQADVRQVITWLYSNTLSPFGT